MRLLQKMLGAFSPAKPQANDTANGGYSSANYTRNRGWGRGMMPTDARKELKSYTRNEIVRRSRSLDKTSGFVRQIGRDMALYSVGDGITPQAMTPDLEWNKAAQRYFADWSRRCDITKRHSFAAMQHLVCKAVDRDGETFVLKVRDAFNYPRLQIVETHRVGSAGGTEKNLVDGILFDDFGAPAAYRVIQDDGTPRDIVAGAVMHVYEPESYSGARAVPITQHAFDDIQDEGEMLSLEKTAVKANSEVTYVLKRKGGSADEDDDIQIGENSTQASAPETTPQDIVRQVGGKAMVIDAEQEELDAHEFDRPNANFTGFLEHVLRGAAGGSLPYDFAHDPSKIGGAAVRLVVGKADRAFNHRQNQLIERMLTPIWTWVIADAIATGALPANADWFRVSWVTPRRVTVDAGRDAAQNREDVKTGLKTLSDDYAERGLDFHEESLRRAQDMAHLVALAKQYGLPLELLYNSAPASPIQSSPPDEPPPAKR